jgi:hypothetical protein
MPWKSLCEGCRSVRVIVTPKQSRFLMCLHAQVDPRYPKYPNQPVRHCLAYGPVSSVPKTELPPPMSGGDGQHES